MTDTKKTPVQLVISTDSWHYKHYCRIRKYFGIDTEIDKVTTLCPYVQTMIWLSVLFVVTMPLQVIGWFTLKTGRWFYRVCETTGLGTIVDLIDNFPVEPSHSIGYAMAKSEESLEDHAWFTLMQWTFGLLLGSAMIGCFAFLLGMLIYMLFFVLACMVFTIPYWPGGIYIGLCHAGWAIVWVMWATVCAFFAFCGWIYWLLSTVVWALIWFFTAGWLWLLVLKGLGVLGLVLIACTILGWVLIQIGSSKTFKRVLDFIKMKFNGYLEARESATERRKEAKRVERKKKEEEREDEGWEPPSQPWIFSVFKSWDFDLLWFKIQNTACAVGEFIRNFFFSRTVCIDTATKKIMSPCAILLSFAWAVKKRICPLITFVTGEELLAQQAKAKKKAVIGKFKLSEEEVVTLQTLALGCTDDDVATELCIDSEAVREHVLSILEKINVNDRERAIEWAVKHGIASLPETDEPSAEQDDA